MLNQETKRKIDNARDILVGKVPDPKAQVEQITTALIYKFMDDMDREAEEIGGKARFFANDYKKYSWGKLINPKLSGQERLDLYVEAIAKMNKNPHLPQLFRDIFKGAFLPYRSPETLNLFLKEINSFEYSHSEDLGDAFEYLLSIMGSQGDAGQFRTPRHIIDFMVEVVDPKKSDKILDPACGTAGFLISAYKHILKNNSSKLKKTKNESVVKKGETMEETVIGGEKFRGDLLTPEERKKLMNNIVGYEISPDMVKLSLVNMYLHGFSEPQIFEYDTLSSEDRWDEMFDVIMANPPFMTPKGGIRPHNRFSVQANRSEVLFVDYILEHLNQKGRAGIIVPEGIIFQAANAYKELRRLLVEDGLFAVVSLPAGVFNPYSGVKTSVLFFDNTIAKQADNILFIKITNDGFDLGAQRRKLDNDGELPIALQVLRTYREGLEKGIGKKFKIDKSLDYIAWLTPKKKIIESGDYNLSGERYKAIESYKKQKWPVVKLGDVVLDMKDGGTPSRKNPEYFGGKIKWCVVKDIQPEITETKETLTELGLKNSSAKVWPKDSVIISLGASIGHVGIAKVPVATKQGLSGIVVNKKKILPEFLYQILLVKKDIIQSFATGVTIKEVRPSKLKELLIFPLPPIRVQKEILKRIEGKQEIINDAKELIAKVERERANSGQIFERLDCEWVELGEVCKTTSGGTPLKSRMEYYEDGSIPWLKSGEVDQGFIYKSQEKITEKGLKDSSAKIFPKDTVLVAMYGATAGKVGLLKFEATTNQAICGILPNDKLYPEFLYYYLMSQTQKIVKLSGGGAQPNISQNIIRKIKIPLPSLEIQKQIAGRFKRQSEAVQANKQLINVFEQQIQDEINEVWGN